MMLNFGIDQVHFLANKNARQLDFRTHPRLSCQKVCVYALLVEKRG